MFALRKSHPSLFLASLAYVVLFIVMGCAYLLDPTGTGSSIGLKELFRHVPQWLLGVLSLSTGLLRLYSLAVGSGTLHRFSSATGLILITLFFFGYLNYAVDTGGSILGIVTYFVMGVTLYTMIVEPPTNPLTER